MKRSCRLGNTSQIVFNHHHHHPRLSNWPQLLLPFTFRWVKTCERFPVTIVAEQHDSFYQWRRFRVHEEQAQRERKNILQKALLFSRRANQMLVEVRAKVSKFSWNWTWTSCFTVHLYYATFCSGWKSSPRSGWIPHCFPEKHLWVQWLRWGVSLPNLWGQCFGTLWIQGGVLLWGSLTWLIAIWLMIEKVALCQSRLHG